jgi:hypothetical protein
MTTNFTLHLKHEVRPGYELGWIATSKPEDASLFKNKNVMFTTFAKPTVIDAVQSMVAQIRNSVVEDGVKPSFVLDVEAVKKLSPEENEAVAAFLEVYA